MTAKPAARNRKPRVQDTIKIRMYNVGFGDCFLLRIPGPDGERKVLFDCGTISGVGAHPIDKIVKQVIADVTDEDKVPRIDVVVGTHRHKDHVSGFGRADWARVEVREVWMPWTEDPKDPEARRIRETQSRLAAALEFAYRSHMQAASEAERGRLAGYQELALNALTNESAMRTLHDGFAKAPRRRFLPCPQPDQASFETDALPRVRIHVLGPSRDKDAIRDMDPPAGQSYLQSLDQMADGSVNPPPAPFRPDWWVSPAEYESTTMYAHLMLEHADRITMKNFELEMDQAVATSLDKAVNGTSLMLMLQIGDNNLLFPGDAQWGTWQAALRNPDWQVLLKETTFYKIGHHGSHNATPIDYIEKTLETKADGFWTMVSTGAVAKWPQIPRQPLLDAISLRTKKLTRSDKLPEVGEGATADETGLYADIEIPVHHPRNDTA
ncbi:MAG TPA: hypothetical protein VLA19_31830 [Herpetosiphonaceae bacterium]|nr:hypothetical protein [Herpetosiphonaceae bacterium]